jgi:hypothetical protein
VATLNTRERPSRRCFDDEVEVEEDDDDEANVKLYRRETRDVYIVWCT